jgi:hypothetical protein
VLGATTEDDFRARVASLLAGRKDGTTPDMGWPWPWEDGRLTDYSYAFDAGKVWVSAFGHAWFDPADPPEDVHAGGKVPFPDMTARRRVTLGDRSGLIVFQASKRRE